MKISAGGGNTTSLMECKMRRNRRGSNGANIRRKKWFWTQLKEIPKEGGLEELRE
jgi:hypothetical protein